MLAHVIQCLTYENRLVCKVCLETGLRVGDVLSLKSSDLKKKSFTITEHKTKKKKVVRLRTPLKKELSSIAGEVYIFSHRTDPQKHRTRQAVYCDIKRACKCFRIKENFSPHSLRKAYAVDLYRRTNDLKKVQEALNHDNELVTILYAMADILNSRAQKKK